MAPQNPELTGTAMDVRMAVDMLSRSDDYFSRYKVLRTIHYDDGRRMFYMNDGQTGRRYKVIIADA